MGGIIDAIFGGSAKDAAQAQVAGSREAMQEFKKGVAEAKVEIKGKETEAKRSRLERAQQVMDMMRSSFRPQLGTMQQGNMNAQQVLGGAGQQMQNAILGQGVDYSGLQPQGINFNPGSFLAGLPEIFDAEAFAAANAQPQAQLPPMAVIGGGAGGAGTGGNIGFGGGGDYYNPFLPHNPGIDRLFGQGQIPDNMMQSGAPMTTQTQRR